MYHVQNASVPASNKPPVSGSGTSTATSTANRATYSYNLSKMFH